MCVAVLAVTSACGESAAPDPPYVWPEALPAAEGLDPALLDSADQHIVRELPNVNALLVARHGRLVYERYYHGRHAEAVQEVHSVTKSFVGAFVGIALHRGWLSGIDQAVLPFFPDIADTVADDRKRAITLRHLLTMSSGIDFERTVHTIPPDWVAAIFQAPLAHDPGTAYLYDGANPHLLSALLTGVAGGDLSTAGRGLLFGPLNITRGRWTADPQGNSNGGTGLFLTARDMAKLGQLYLQDGVWEGTRLLAEGWVARSTTPAFDLPGAWDYGFLWWTAPPEVYGARAWIAAGYRGQLIMVFPDLALILTIQSESLAPRGPIQDHSFLAARYVVPAVRGE